MSRLREINWQAADVYSFGMVCYEIIPGEIPFDGRPFSKFDGVLAVERPELSDHVTDPLKDIILGCWHSDPNCRPNFKDIVESLEQSYAIVKIAMESTFGLLKNVESRELLQLKKRISIMNGFDDDCKARVMTLLAYMESEFDDAGTPESRLLQLKKIAAIHMETNIEAKAGQTNYADWASEYAATLNQFISEFGWKSFTSHLFLPFAKYVERRRLLVLLIQQYAVFCHTCQESENVQFQLDTSREKLIIVQATMESLLDADVEQDSLLLLLGDLILRMDPEHTNPEIQKFHMVMTLIIIAYPYRNYLVLLVYFMEAVLQIIILYLVYLALIFSGCNYVLTYFGCGLLGFHECSSDGVVLEWVACSLKFLHYIHCMQITGGKDVWPGLLLELLAVR